MLLTLDRKSSSLLIDIGINKLLKTKNCFTKSNAAHNNTTIVHHFFILRATYTSHTLNLVKNTHVVLNYKNSKGISDGIARRQTFVQTLE